MIQLGRTRGYTFIGTTTTGCNAFFVRDDLAAKVAPALTDAWGYPSRVREARDEDGTLLFLDGAEVGYIPFDTEAANLFFQLVSTRYEKSSSNLPFFRWGQVFGEATTASAMIDRIVHHADVIALKGASYRIKHTTIESLPSVEAERQAN